MNGASVKSRDIDTRQHLLEIYQRALQSVNGEARVQNYLTALNVPDQVYIIAVGKAAPAMVRAAQTVWGKVIRDAFIVTKHGYGEDLKWPCMEAGHPIPDKKSLEAGEALIEFVKKIPGNAEVLVLLSGGASTLIEKLPEGMDLKDLVGLNVALLAGGYPIETINWARQQLSALKGGRLARMLAPRTTRALLISDVPDDDPAIIGSGPVSPSSKVCVTDGLPDFARELISRFTGINAPEIDDRCFSSMNTYVVANQQQAIDAAAKKAKGMGHKVQVHEEFQGGDVMDVANHVASEMANAEVGVIHIWGAEPTVHLPAKPGRGGRCQSLALKVAQVWDEQDVDALLLAGCTDGSDGPGEDAGAMVDKETIKRGQESDYDPDDALIKADAGSFLDASGDLIQTGPTGTNVMDLIIGLRCG